MMTMPMRVLAKVHDPLKPVKSQLSETYIELDETLLHGRPVLRHALSTLAKELIEQLREYGSVDVVGLELRTISMLVLRQQLPDEGS